MKFSIYLAVAIFLLSTKIFPQWEIINPSPLLDRAFVIYSDSLNCDVLTQRGNIASSSDGGSSWDYHYSNSPVSLFSVFFKGEIGWALGEITYKSTDRGRSWVDKGTVLEYTSKDIFFSDTLNGWAVGNSYIKSTTDGGDTWTTQQLSGQLQFISQYKDSILFTASYDSLYRSTDFGESWYTLQESPEGNFWDFAALHTDSLTYGFLLCGDKVEVTTDAGNTWDSALPDTYTAVKKIKANGGLLLVISNTKIFRSTNFGVSWDTVYIPAGDYSNASFGTDNIIYMSDPEGKLIKSTDGGLSFFNIINSKLSGSVTSMSATDSDYIYLTAGNGKIYKTINGGESFIDIAPENFPITDNVVSVVTRDMAIALASTKIYTTKDGGQNWNVSTYGPPDTYIPTDVYFRDTLNGMVSCAWGLMRETADGGDSWTNRFMVSDTTQMHLLSLSFPNPENGYFCTGDKLYNTTNGGTDWNYHSYLDPQLGRVKFTDVMNGVGRTFQNLYYTSDGGTSWSECDSVNPCSDFDIMKNGSGSVLMVLAQSYVYTSIDYGRTFTKQNLPAEGFYKIRMIDPANAWIAGYNGKIVRYHNDGIITKTESPEIRITGFSLSQNYPNPFNPSTIIKYSIPADSYVTLKIFDMLGREITSLVKAQQAAGNYDIKFNAASMASGIYFYRLEARTIGSDAYFSKVNKMTLLK